MNRLQMLMLSLLAFKNKHFDMDRFIAAAEAAAHSKVTRVSHKSQAKLRLARRRMGDRCRITQRKRKPSWSKLKAGA